MLNAQVVAGDTLHTVYMAISRNDRIGLVSISTPTTATVTFRRNYISHNVIN